MWARAKDKEGEAQAVVPSSRRSAMASPLDRGDPVRTWLATFAGSSEDSQQVAAASLLLGVRVRQTTVGAGLEPQVTKLLPTPTQAPTPPQADTGPIK